MYSVANGNIGIGTASPSSKLEIPDVSANGLRLSGSGDHALGFTGYSANAATQVFSIRNDGISNLYVNTQNSIPLNFGVSTGTSFGSTASQMRIDSSGRMTVPNQPAFHASKSSTPNGTSENPVQYDTVEFNIGGHYNNSTYRFTAPVAGRYFITTQFSFYIGSGGARQIEIGIKLNGGVWQSTDTFTTQTQGNNTHCNGTVAAVMNLAAGDYVQGAWISSTASVNFYSPGLRISFSGYLIG
jgi:hypothetical protein